MIPKTYIDYYGDQMRWFVGTVVDLNDPLKIGRVRVRALGVYDEIADKDLPWAQVVVPINQGAHEGNGQYLGLLKGSQVFGMFLDGKNSQLPMVIGTIPKEGDDNSKAESNYPQNKVYETEKGNFKEWDDKDDRIKEGHHSGTYYEMTKDGVMKIYADTDVIIEAKGKVTISAPVVDISGADEIRLNS